MPSIRTLLALTMALLLALPGAAATLDLQGHRGARGLAPENSLAGFERALTLGVTTLELDVVMTRDDVLVIHHDRDLNPDITRGPDGRFLERRGPPLRSLSFDELQRYDVGRINPASRYAASHAQQQGLDGVRIPRLTDLFELLRRSGNERVRLAIETKLHPQRPEESPPPEVFARAVIAAVRAAGLEQRSAVLSFDWRTLAVVQREAPQIETVYLTAQQSWLDNVRPTGLPGASPWTAGHALREHGSVPKLIHAAGGRTWSSYHGDLDANAMAQARALGLKVLAWTVNDAAEIERALDLGVDGIVTDRPDVAREVMRRRGLPLPYATTPTR